MRERLAAARRTWDTGLLIFLVMGGIYGKIFSPMEAAAVGAGGVILIAATRGGLRGGVLLQGIMETAGMTGISFSSSSEQRSSITSSSPLVSCRR